MMDTLKSVNSLISANDSAKETAIENDIVEIVNEIIASEAPGRMTAQGRTDICQKYVSGFSPECIV